MAINKTKEKLKIVVTGGSGRFGNSFRKINTKHRLYFPSKKELNILKPKSINNYLNRIRPKILIHLAALSRPMIIHETNIAKSISLNIIGTANTVIECAKLNIKIIYISTNFIYPGTKGSYQETDAINPINNYAWSKLGGETSVKLYKNSLILRTCVTERPFIHKKAFVDVQTNFEYHDIIAEKIMKLLKYKGVINVGGKIQSIYKFAKKSNNKIKKIYARKLYGNKYPLKQSMNIEKLKRLTS